MLIKGVPRWPLESVHMVIPGADDAGYCEMGGGSLCDVWLCDSSTKDWL